MRGSSFCTVGKGRLSNLTQPSFMSQESVGEERSYRPHSRSFFDFSTPLSQIREQTPLDASKHVTFIARHA